MIRRQAIARTTTATDPCTLLAQAQNALNLLLMGQLPAEIETPQLGRVQFSRANIGDLQRYIDTLTVQCNQAQGICGGGRKPISFEAWP
jgi:hypothetical protein